MCQPMTRCEEMFVKWQRDSRTEAETSERQSFREGPGANIHNRFF